MLAVLGRDCKADQPCHMMMIESESAAWVALGAGIGATDVELDDGSGMAWLKRRKEEKERKARE